MRTISLHNIRYELLWRGNDLWAVGAGREMMVGSVRPIADSGRWGASAAGYLVETFPDEGTARGVIEQVASELGGGFTVLT